MRTGLMRRKRPKRGDGQTRPPPRPPCWKENARKWLQLATAVIVLLTSAIGFANAMLQ
jgi:hypothetical protein